MLHVTLSMPADLKQWVDARVSGEGFADMQAYVEALIARDRSEHEAAVARVQALIDEGLASGVCDKDAFAVIDELIAGIR